MFSKVQVWSPQPPTWLVFLAKVLYVPYSSSPAPSSRNQKNAKLSLGQNVSWQQCSPLPPNTVLLYYAESSVPACAHTCLIHLTSTKAWWHQADAQYTRLKTPIPAPAHSAGAHYCTLRLLDRKVRSNSTLSICTFPWTVKSIAIPFNTWLCTLVLNTAVYQLNFTARVLLATHLLPENRGLGWRTCNRCCHYSRCWLWEHWWTGLNQGH